MFVIFFIRPPPPIFAFFQNFEQIKVSGQDSKPFRLAAGEYLCCYMTCHRYPNIYLIYAIMCITVSQIYKILHSPIWRKWVSKTIMVILINYYKERQRIEIENGLDSLKLLFGFKICLYMLLYSASAHANTSNKELFKNTFFQRWL